MRHLIFFAVRFVFSTCPQSPLVPAPILSATVRIRSANPNANPNANANANAKPSQGQLRYHCQHAIESSPLWPASALPPSPSHYFCLLFHIDCCVWPGLAKSVLVALLWHNQSNSKVVSVKKAQNVVGGGGGMGHPHRHR